MGARLLLRPLTWWYMLTLYKYITASLAFAGCLGLMITGELNPVFIMPGIMMLPGYYRYIAGRPPISRWLVAGLALLEVFVLGFDILFVSSDFLIAIAHMTIVFQALKSFDMREPWDPLQVYFMSILQVIITSELSLSILVGVFFAVFLVLFMAAMVFSHFMKEGTLREVRFVKPALYITLGALFLTVIFFVSIPRLSGGLWGRQSSTGLRSVGFSENVELGSYGRVLGDSSIVMRAEIDGRDLPLYWRGSTLNSFDGVRWQSSTHQKERIYRRKGRFDISQRPHEDDEVNVQKIILEPLDTEVIFGLGEILSIESKGWLLYANDNGVVSLAGKSDRRISYTVKSILDTGNRDVSLPYMYLQLPEGMERLQQLSDSIARGKSSDYEKAMAIIRYLNSGFRYTLSPRAPAVEVSPIDWFLFGSREGYCEHFSTAMALMLRTQGIPSRIVTGFLGGDENQLGNYVIVRQSDAHSWVEAGIRGKWVRFDPTPVLRPSHDSAVAMLLDSLRMNWYRYVIGFSSYDQVSMLSSLTLPMFETPDIKGIKINVSPLYAIGTLLVGLILMVLLIRGRRGSGGRVMFSTSAYMVLRKELRKKGAVLHDSFTPEELEREAARVKADRAKVSEVTEIYIANRFGGKKLSEEDRRRIRALSRNPF